MADLQEGQRRGISDHAIYFAVATESSTQVLSVCVTTHLGSQDQANAHYRHNSTLNEKDTIHLRRFKQQGQVLKNDRPRVRLGKYLLTTAGPYHNSSMCSGVLQTMLTIISSKNTEAGSYGKGRGDLSVEPEEVSSDSR